MEAVIDPPAEAVGADAGPGVGAAGDAFGAPARDAGLDELDAVVQRMMDLIPHL